MKWLLLLVSLNTADVMDRFDSEAECTTLQRRMNTYVSSTGGQFWYFCVPLAKRP
jgi:hypothetical protein